jgi:hypothetical protein
MDNVHVGIQIRRDAAQLIRADVSEAVWETDVDVVRKDGVLDFRGPAVQGKVGDRFIYLTWGNVLPDDEFAMFRRAKLMLDRVERDLMESAMKAGRLDAWSIWRMTAVVPGALESTLPPSCGRSRRADRILPAPHTAGLWTPLAAGRTRPAAPPLGVSPNGSRAESGAPTEWVRQRARVRVGRHRSARTCRSPLRGDTIDARGDARTAQIA